MAMQRTESWRPWVQVLAGFFAMFCTLGLGNAFGTFQTYYVSTLPNHSPSVTAWIGTTQGAFLNIVGFISGPLCDKGHIKSLIVAGALLNVLGLLAASFATAFWSAFLSLGVCVGLGCGILYVPARAIVAASFGARRRPLAVGLCDTGSSAGGIAYPFLFAALRDRFGFVWTCRSFCLLNCALLGLSILLFRPVPAAAAGANTDDNDDAAAACRPEEDEGAAKVGTLFEVTAFRDRHFVLFCFAMFLLWLGVDLPFYFVPHLVQSKGYSEKLGFYLISGLNAASLIGRVVTGIVAVYTGSMSVWQVSIAASCVLLACWGTVLQAIPGIATFVFFYGFATGAVLSLYTPVLTSISPNLRVVGSRLGMSSLASGCGYLVGPPIVGALLEAPLGYAAQSAFAASTTFTALLLTAVIWLTTPSKPMIH